jgi:hypothetical protein
MRKLFLTCLVALAVAFLPSQDAHAKKWMYWAYSLVGGTTGALDNIDACNTDGAGTDLADADSAIVVERTGGVLYFYFFNATSGAAQASPYIITPTKCDGGAYAGTGRWVLTSLMAGGATSQVDFGTTGGRITAASGVFTIAGIGNTNNENLTIDFEGVANTVTIGTGTGVTNLSLGGINLVTTGTMSGLLPTVVDSAASAVSISVAQAKAGTFFINTLAGTKQYILPPAEPGMAVCVRNGQGNVRILQLDTDGTDYIITSAGLRTTGAGDIYAATASAANQICVATFDATDWYVTSERGTWAEE